MSWQRYTSTSGSWSEISTAGSETLRSREPVGRSSAYHSTREPASACAVGDSQTYGPQWSETQSRLPARVSEPTSTAARSAYSSVSGSPWSEPKAPACEGGSSRTYGMLRSSRAGSEGARLRPRSSAPRHQPSGSPRAWVAACARATPSPAASPAASSPPPPPLSELSAASGGAGAAPTAEPDAAAVEVCRLEKGE